MKVGLRRADVVEKGALLESFVRRAGRHTRASSHSRRRRAQRILPASGQPCLALISSGCNYRSIVMSSYKSPFLAAASVLE